uniref:Immunoglobulin V-set domain-containing protein n=1 Tax=Anas platyrhynchos TaxID=8839 RepID=A0A8B9SST2_ANAPL
SHGGYRPGLLLCVGWRTAAWLRCLSVSIPHAEALLHMDCNGEEMSCELSLYSSRRDSEGPCRASWFMATLQLSGGISIALVLRGPCSSGQEEEGHDAVLHPKLGIPVSKEGTLLTTVEFQSSSSNTSMRTRLGGSVTLDCRFALAPSSTLSSLEWRRQAPRQRPEHLPVPAPGPAQHPAACGW